MTATLDGTLKIRWIHPDDHAEWVRLFTAYCAVGHVSHTDDDNERVWSWILGPDHQTSCLVADDGTGHLLGLAHIRPFERPMAASVGLWLDDLFVDEAARGQRIASRLLEAVRTHAAEAGYGLVRWTTGPDNLTAQALYNHVATIRDVLDYETTPLS